MASRCGAPLVATGDVRFIEAREPFARPHLVDEATLDIAATLSSR